MQTSPNFVKKVVLLVWPDAQLNDNEIAFSNCIGFACGSSMSMGYYWEPLINIKIDILNQNIVRNLMYRLGMFLYLMNDILLIKKHVMNV